MSIPEDFDLSGNDNTSKWIQYLVYLRDIIRIYTCSKDEHRLRFITKFASQLYNFSWKLQENNQKEFESFLQQVDRFEADRSPMAFFCGPISNQLPEINESAVVQFWRKLYDNIEKTYDCSLNYLAGHSKKFIKELSFHRQIDHKKIATARSLQLGTINSEEGGFKFSWWLSPSIRNPLLDPISSQMNDPLIEERKDCFIIDQQRWTHLLIIMAVLYELDYVDLNIPKLESNQHHPMRLLKYLSFV